jgi:GNAT superfamily N-acetyltransferase
MVVSIDFYSDKMKDQVIMLFCNQYNEDINQFTLFFEKFYEHSFQKNKAIKIVALEGDKVVGFQSFFYWPYQSGEMIYNSFQSGNSLVHPEYRGQGLFRKMLAFVYENGKEIDFMVGFPVQASYNSFIRNKWTNLFNLQWYIKQVSFIAPITSSFYSAEDRLSQVFTIRNKEIKEVNNKQELKLLNNLEFNEWRNSYSKDIKFYFFFKQDEKEIEFELKYNVRKKIIGELIVGRVSTNSNEEKFIHSAIKELLLKSKKTKVITLVSVALNSNNKGKINLIIRKSFKKIEKQIYFILKGGEENKKLNNVENWNLSRADIDTW